VKLYFEDLMSRYLWRW